MVGAETRMQRLNYDVKMSVLTIFSENRNLGSSFHNSNTSCVCAKSLQCRFSRVCAYSVVSVMSDSL